MGILWLQLLVPVAAVGAASVSSTRRLVRVTADGSSPHRTVNDALHWAHEGGWTSTSDELVIDVGPGTYPPFTVLPEHGRVRVTGTAGATTVSGGIEVPPSLFKPSPTQPSVYVADLATLGIEASQFGAINAGDCIHGCVDVPSPVSMGTDRLTLARWPNINLSNGHNVYAHGGKSCGAGCLEVAASSSTERIKSWASQPGGWIHGYFEWDWADCYRNITAVTETNGSFLIKMDASEAPKPNARFYGLNLMSELDAPGEYFLELGSGTQRLHLIPPPSVSGGPSTWSHGPIVAINATVVNISYTTGVTVEDISVMHARGRGVVAQGVVGTTISNVTSTMHGQQGIYMSGALDSRIVGATVAFTGCAAIRAHGGDAATLQPGNITVSGNHVHHFALWKRTYNAGIHWNGVSNAYSHNVVHDGPHNCFLGGGNEADSDTAPAALNNVFEGNTLDTCAFEAADTGAFYTCGQDATAFVNRNNTIRGCTFRNIRNTAGTGVQGPSVQAIYLDDQMSDWTIENNSFVNCQTGSFIGGGRRVTVKHNYYEKCDTAQHLDNRGMNWQKSSANCTQVCPPFHCTCNRGAAIWFRTQSPAASAWRSTVYPDGEFSADGIDPGVPRDNVIEGNTYCKCGKFIDASSAQSAAWGTTVDKNTEITKC